MTDGHRTKKIPTPPLGFWALLAVVALLAAFFAVLAYSSPRVDGDRLRLDRFVELANPAATGGGHGGAGQVDGATADPRILTANILDADGFVVGEYVRDDGTTARYNAPYLSGSRERLVGILLDAGIPTTVVQQFSKTLVTPATLLLPALIIVVVFVYLLLSYRRGSGLFAITSGARQIHAEDADVSFADVAGQADAVAELSELAAFLSDPQRFRELGATIPKGVLLYGPPGCGKTLTARALAGEAGASFFSISGSDFVELYVGVGASRVRDLFRMAREQAPAIVFIDELDAVGRRRGGSGAGGGSHQEQEQSLNQILTEMDGFSPSEGIIVLGATNRPDVLDPALLRPGRFDRAVGLERVDRDGRLQILTVHARDKRLADDVDLDVIAAKTVGMTGADLANLINEAALLAARGRHPSVSQGELLEALRRIREAPERQRRLALRGRNVGQRSLDDEKVTFADVAGIDEAVTELSEVASYLADPERFVAVGARPPRGFLLVGPPGCGKTLLARAVAGEVNASFVSIAASEFTEVYVGEGAGRVRDLFAEARAAAPSILFIDEIDGVGARRGGGVDGHREHDQTLNQILTEMDGFSGRTGVIVMAATNRPDILDPALVRPGRFDRQVTVETPDRAGRARILAVHGRELTLAGDIDFDEVATLTPGFSGADLANVLNEAALLAARHGMAEVSMREVEEGVQRALFGLSSKARRMSERERTVVAYHEAGHALAGMALSGANPPHKLTILPRGRTLGHVWHPDTGDRHLVTRSMMVDQMAAGLAGRVAEQLVFGEPTDGACGDLSTATATARRMVTELGMSRHLPLRTYHDAAGCGCQSESTATAVDAEIGALVDTAATRARDALEAARTDLDRVARALLEHETLTAAQLTGLVAEAARPANLPATGVGVLAT